MRKVKNKEVIRRLSDKSFKVNKTRNLIAVVAIALTSMLFSALFSVGIGTVYTFQRQTARQSGGDAHGVFKELTQEEYEKLKAHPLIKESMPCRLVADYVRNPEFLKRHAEAWYYPEEAYPHCFIDIIEGKAPKAADEILLDETSLELLGLPKEPGQKVTLDLQLHNYDETITERTFTVSGVIKSDPALDVGFALVSQAYVEKYAQELEYKGQDDTGSTMGAIRMDVIFSNSLGIQKKLDQVLTESGFSTEPGDDNYIACNANWAYVSDGADADPATVGAVAGALVLILITGYLIIYNIFRISIMKDIRYYGLLKTIGTTGRQIKKIIRRQALKLSAIGIPIGLLAGFFVGKALLPAILNSTGTVAQGETHIPVSPWIFIGAAVFSLITVFISTGHPAKMAAKVSPIEALRFTEGKKEKKKGKRSSGGGKIWRMALSNLGRSKGKTAIIIVSLSLAVVLLNSVFTVTNSFDMDLFLRSFTSSDFLIANAKYFNTEYYHGSNEATIDEENLTESFIEACQSINGFKEGGRIYAANGKVGVKKEGVTIPEGYDVNEAGEPGEYYGKNFIPIPSTENGDYSSMFYGVEDFIVDEMKVWKGESDVDTIREKLATGDYIIYSTLVDDKGEVYEDKVLHQPGDKIILSYTDLNGEYKEKEVTVLSVIKDDYWNLTNRISSEFTYYVSADFFKEILSDKYLMSYSFNVEEGKDRDVDAWIASYTESSEPLMDYSSKLQYVEQFSSITGMFLMVGGSLAFVIGFIGLLNFINSILTGIISRQREFAMMQAIGMTRRQLTKLVIVEGLYYALLTIVFSLAAGCIFSLTIVRKLSEGMWFMKYQFLITPMLIVFPVLILLGVLVPYLAFRFGNSGSVVEELQKVD